MSWAELFTPSVSIWELLLRGTVMYLAVFVMMRVVGRRVAGQLNTSDLILVLIISEATSTGLAGEATSILDSVIVVATVLAWALLLDIAGYNWRWAEALLKPKPQPLIIDGVLNRAVARRELLTRSEILAQLREQGVSEISEVYRAYVEPAGDISVQSEPAQDK